MDCQTFEIILEIGISSNGQIYIRPKESSFTMIYREAKGVNWNIAEGILHSSVPKDWDYYKWFLHIIEVASIQTRLTISNETKWTNIPESLRVKIEKGFSI